LFYDLRLSHYTSATDDNGRQTDRRQLYSKVRPLRSSENCTDILERLIKILGTEVCSVCAREDQTDGRVGDRKHGFLALSDVGPALHKIRPTGSQRKNLFFCYLCR